MRSIDELHAIVDELQRAADDVQEAALGDDIVQIRGVINRLEALTAVLLGRFDKSRSYESDGAVTPVAWLQWKCRLSAAGAAERVGMARTLPSLPETASALSNGDIGYSSAALLSMTAGKVGCDAVRDAEHDLLRWSRELDVRRFAILLRHFRHAVDPDGALADANEQHERRYLHLSCSMDGLYHLDGLLDADGGAALHSAVNALSMPLADDARSPKQRRADALVELARRQLDSGSLPYVAGQRPHLTLTATRALVRALPSQPAGELEWGMPVPRETVRRLACDASLTMVILDSDGAPLNVGRATRTIPPAIRRALALRDRGCRFPGCDRPVAWTDGHHVRHWADGGETKLENLVLLCRRHHRMVHEEGWRLLRGEEGEILAIPPDRLRRCDVPAG